MFSEFICTRAALFSEDNFVLELHFKSGPLLKTAVSLLQHKRNTEKTRFLAKAPSRCCKALVDGHVDGHVGLFYNQFSKFNLHLRFESDEKCPSTRSMNTGVLKSLETTRAQTGRGEGEARSSATGTSEGGVPGLACVPRSMLCSTGEEGTGSVLFRVDTTC